MSNAPYLLLKARAGYRMGHSESIDHMFYDGLQSPWDGQAMGCFADATADKLRLDARSAGRIRSRVRCRAQRAVRDGDFIAEVAPVTFKTRKGEQVVAQDETPFALDIDKIPTLKPAFRKDGTVTAASSSSISDDAAALVVASESAAAAGGLKPDRAHRRLRQRTPRRPSGSRRRPATRSQKALRPRRTGRPPTSTSTKSTKPSPCVAMAATQRPRRSTARVNVNVPARCRARSPRSAPRARGSITTLAARAAGSAALKRGMALAVHRRRRGLPPIAIETPGLTSPLLRLRHSRMQIERSSRRRHHGRRPRHRQGHRQRRSPNAARRLALLDLRRRRISNRDPGRPRRPRRRGARSTPRNVAKEDQVIARARPGRRGATAGSTCW